MVKLDEFNCKRCGGIINVEKKAKHNMLSALAAITIAIALAFSNIGLKIGIPLGLYGLYMAAAAQKKCLCRSYRAMLQIT
jgi:hypothetical protein